MPIRTCIGCRQTGERAELVRLVRDGAGRVKVDMTKQLPGRGAWVHARRGCVEGVVKSNGLSRSFRGKTQPVDADGLWSALNEEKGSRS